MLLHSEESEDHAIHLQEVLFYNHLILLIFAILFLDFLSLFREEFIFFPSREKEIVLQCI